MHAFANGAQADDLSIDLCSHDIGNMDQVKLYFAAAFVVVDIDLIHPLSDTDVHSYSSVLSIHDGNDNHRVHPREESARCSEATHVATENRQGKRSHYRTSEMEELPR